MLRIFRNLRLRFINGSNARRYFFYAIGEILLVVIGILLALQVNNWNEERKSTRAQRFLLMSLQEDFKIRSAELHEFKIARKESISAIHQLNAIINHPENMPSMAKMDSLIGTIGNALTFNDQFKTLDMLFTTGMINELTNEDLKRRLILWPQQVEEMMEEQRLRLRNTDNFFTPLMFKYIAVREVYEKFDFRGYNIDPGSPVTFPSDYLGILKDPAFERYLADLEINLKVNDIDSDILIDNSANIIALLQQEINTF